MLAQVCQDKTPITSLRNHFENTVVHLTPSNLVARKQTKTTKSGNIAAVEGGNNPTETIVSAFGEKSGKGKKNDVDLWYHTNEEHENITKEQKSEPYYWQKENGVASSSNKRGRNDSSGEDRKKQKKRRVEFDKKFLASLETTIDSKLKAIQETQMQENLTKAYI